MLNIWYSEHQCSISVIFLITFFFHDFYPLLLNKISERRESRCYCSVKAVCNRTSYQTLRRHIISSFRWQYPIPHGCRPLLLHRELSFFNSLFIAEAHFFSLFLSLVVEKWKTRWWNSSGIDPRSSYLCSSAKCWEWIWAMVFAGRGS